MDHLWRVHPGIYTRLVLSHDPFLALFSHTPAFVLRYARAHQSVEHLLAMRNFWHLRTGETLDGLVLIDQTAVA